MNKSRADTTFKTICHPYFFALKEGNQIENNLLDYSLIMLIKTSTEVVKGPAKKRFYLNNKKVNN